MTTYAMTLVLPGTIASVRPTVEAAIKEQGFGVLTEIDVQKTLKEKIGAEVAPYVILGACNPKIAHAALEAVPAAGLLLPCNVTLRDVPGGVEVAIVDPSALFCALPSDLQRELEPLAKEARTRLQAALAAMG